MQQAMIHNDSLSVVHRKTPNALVENIGVTITLRNGTRVVVQTSGFDSPSMASQQSIEVKIVKRFESSAKFGSPHGLKTSWRR
jgi:hypothetical protein